MATDSSGNDFAGRSVDDCYDIVTADKTGQMRHQAEGWRGLAFLFQSQLDQLNGAVGALQQHWTSPAGQTFVEEVGRIQKTLQSGLEIAKGNEKAWSAIADKADATWATVY